VAVKIKLKRLGKMREPHYRIIVADAREKRDGRAIEEIGHYHPKDDPSTISVNSERVQYWLRVGAQPTEPVAAILRVTGDWQQFKGQPAPEPMKVAAPKPDKKAVFEAAAKESAREPEDTATTPKSKGRKSSSKASSTSGPVPDGKAEAQAEEKLEAPVEKGGTDKGSGPADQPAEA
jgi:small subunit ribosomal protein S16